MRYLIFIVFVLFAGGCTVSHKGDSRSAALNMLVQRAEKASDDDNYIKAVQCYIDAILEAEEFVPDQVESFKRDLAIVYLDWARTLYWDAKKNRSERDGLKAITMAERAAEIDPRREIRCRNLIEKLQKELASIKYKNATDIDRLDPNHKERLLQIALLSKQAAVFFESGQYMRSRDRYEEVLLVDPFNIEAIRGLKRVMREVSRVGAKRKELTEKERMAEVEWNYVEAIAIKEKKAQESQSDKPVEISLKEKLSECIIQKIDFNDLALDKVFAVLEKEIAVALKNDFRFKFNGFSPADKNLPPVTFKVTEIPADDAVKVICEGMNLDAVYKKDEIIISRQK